MAAILAGTETDVNQTALPLIVYCGKDADLTSAKMTAVNLAVARAPGYAIQGNTLTNETGQGWRCQPTEQPPLITLKNGPDPFVVDCEEAAEPAPVVDLADASGSPDNSDLAEQVQLGQWPK